MPLIDSKAKEIVNGAEPDLVLAPDSKLEEIAPELAGAKVVAVEFPKFRDGRGFTIARALRGHYGYKGEIRAVGHYLPDQFEALISCGFTSFLTPAEHSQEQFSLELQKPRQPGQLLRKSIGRALEQS